MVTKKISLRARKYIVNKVTGMTNYRAAVEAGYSQNTAINASTNIENRGVKKLIEEIMDEQGLTNEKLVFFLSDGLNNASKMVGTEEDYLVVPDYAVRHRYLETAFKLNGRLEQGKQAISQTANSTEIAVIAYGTADPLYLQTLGSKRS